VAGSKKKQNALKLNVRFREKSTMLLNNFYAMLCSALFNKLPSVNCPSDVKSFHGSESLLIYFLSSSTTCAPPSRLLPVHPLLVFYLSCSLRLTSPACI
jgi:hypothetical protein